MSWARLVALFTKILVPKRRKHKAVPKPFDVPLQMLTTITFNTTTCEISNENNVTNSSQRAWRRWRQTRSFCKFAWVTGIHIVFFCRFRSPLCRTIHFWSAYCFWPRCVQNETLWKAECCCLLAWKNTLLNSVFFYARMLKPFDSLLQYCMEKYMLWADFGMWDSIGRIWGIWGAILGGICWEILDGFS